MDELIFNITNNPWINNGIIRLIIELESNFSNKINIQMSKNSINLSSKDENDILNYVDKAIYHLASTGTYNFSQAFKIINKHSGANFTPPSHYPTVIGEAKNKIEISEDDKKVLKENSNQPTDKNQQIWKMRLSYLGSEKNYLGYGLDFKSSSEFKKLESNENTKNICPSCGLISKNMIDNKQYFNPLSNEHHNNEIEGVSSNIRKTIKLCPNCVTSAFFSLFDKYIPFYRNSRGNTFLALPNIYDFEVLKKIENNLSLNSQYIDLSSPDTTRYSTNIKSFGNSECNSAALLSLLHNIQNNYSIAPVDILFADLTEVELMSIVDWIFINKDSSSINEIKADSNVYNILKSQKDPTNNSDIYLVTDFFNKIKFIDLSEAYLESFYNSFLKLNYVSIANNLFRLTKHNISKIIDYNNGYSFYLFNRVFLDQIMGEIIMLDDKLKEACKTIAQSVGKSFYKDIGMMTKFAYATDEEVFKQYIEESSFLMAKKSALNNENYYLNINDLEVLFDNLDGKNFKELKSYFVSFMSASALYENFNQNKNKSENKGGE